MEKEAERLRELQELQANHSGEDSMVMNTEEDKALADGRSVYVGNVSGTFGRVQHRVFNGRVLLRWTTRQLQRRYKGIFKHAGQSIE